MMFCPKCGAEYREGFYECADCHVQLVWELPPEPEKKPDELKKGQLELITVVKVENTVHLALVKSTLEEAGIPFIVKGIISDDVILVGKVDAEVQVDREDEQETKRLLAELDNLSHDIVDDTEE